MFLFCGPVSSVHTIFGMHVSSPCTNFVLVATLTAFLTGAYNAVSRYYKELAEEVDGGIPLKPTTDDVLPSYDESLAADQGNIRI